MDEQSRLEALREYLWALDRQTRRAIGMDPTALLDRSQLTPEERELADRFASDGGRRPSEDRGATDVEDTRDPGASEAMDAGAGHDGDGGDGDDEGSAFDVGGYGLRNRVGLVLGPLLFAAILLAPSPQGLSPAGQAVGATTAWVATWWITEAIPIPATSLLPIVLFPATGAIDVDATTAPYASTYIFLFMGGFFIAMAMQRWGLHRRIALRIIKAIGTSPSRIILGFMVATGFLSMWVSNTATTVMMTPIGLAVILQTRSLIEGSDADIPTAQGEFNFGTGLMLCIAYSASIGGVATIIGTPPNLILVGAISETFGREISFAQWMLYGVPIAVVGIAIVWGYVVKTFIPPRMDSIPGGLDVIDEELQSLGPMSREEKPRVRCLRHGRAGLDLPVARRSLRRDRHRRFDYRDRRGTDPLSAPLAPGGRLARLPARLGHRHGDPLGRAPPFRRRAHHRERLRGDRPRRVDRRPVERLPRGLDRARHRRDRRAHDLPDRSHL
jgi:sodium-dependent dicarboxylate transporter 2/3/5